MDQKISTKDKLDLGFNFLGIVASLIVGAASMIIFIYNNFPPRSEYDKDRADVIQKLDRMDNKLDRLFEERRHDATK